MAKTRKYTPKNTFRDPDDMHKLYEAGVKQEMPVALIERDKQISGDSDGDAEAEADSTGAEAGDLPEDFPHAGVLAENNVTTYGQLGALIDDEALEDLDGIGEGKAGDIREAYDNR